MGKDKIILIIFQLPLQNTIPSDYGRNFLLIKTFQLNFEQLGLIKPILDALKTQGYEQPTPIQEKAIPPILQGKDLLGSAQTGTGKTAAFAIPILQNLSDKQQFRNQIKALILTPTRELAIQIDENFKAYSKT
jgi:ATP-dependent RNA helicase RhlE